MNKEKTFEIIEKIKSSGIGEAKKWESLLKKIHNEKELNDDDKAYVKKFSSIYKDGSISRHSKILHVKLEENDDKPACKTCGEKSQFYCNMNDEYFCITHIVGHDENEL